MRTAVKRRRASRLKGRGGSADAPHMSPKHILAAACGAAALAAPAVALAAVKPHGTYKGTTSQVNDAGQHAQIAISVAKHARKVSKLSIQVRADCDNGPAQYFALPGHDEKIDSKGRFKDSGTVKGSADGQPASVTAVIHGRFVSSTKAKGTFTATEDISDASGNVVSHCTSGTVTWTATRKR